MVKHFVLTHVPKFRPWKSTFTAYAGGFLSLFVLKFDTVSVESILYGLTSLTIIKNNNKKKKNIRCI